MTYKDRMEDIVETLRVASDIDIDMIKTVLAKVGPQIIDMGIVADKLSDDVSVMTKSSGPRPVGGLQDLAETTPLMEMGEAIRKHGLPNIDRRPLSYWQNRQTIGNAPKPDGTDLLEAEEAALKELSKSSGPEDVGIAKHISKNPGDDK